MGHTPAMVLVAPQQLAPTPWTAPVPLADEVTARDEVLALLRDGSGRRPRFDPELAGGLRSWLEDGAAELVASRGEDAPPLFLGPSLLWDTAARAADPEELAPPLHGAHRSMTGQEPYSLEFVRSCLVRALFRQVVTTGIVDDP